MLHAEIRTVPTLCWKQGRVIRLSHQNYHLFPLVISVCGACLSTRYISTFHSHLHSVVQFICIQYLLHLEAHMLCYNSCPRKPPTVNDMLHAEKLHDNYLRFRTVPTPGYAYKCPRLGTSIRTHLEIPTTVDTFYPSTSYNINNKPKSDKSITSKITKNIKIRLSNRALRILTIRSGRLPICHLHSTPKPPPTRINQYALSTLHTLRGINHK